MNGDRVGRAQLCISTLSALLGLYAMINASFSFSGPGQFIFLEKDDSYFISRLFQFNALGGAVLIVAGVLGIVAVLLRTRAFGWLATIVAAVAGIVVLVGAGNAETSFGSGRPSNAAPYLIAAVGIATTQWAATVAPTNP